MKQMSRKKKTNELREWASGVIFRSQEVYLRNFYKWGAEGAAGRKRSGKWEIKKKTKQRKSVSCRRDIGSIQKSCCSQLTPEDARWLGERTWKDWDHSQIHPFLSPHIHNTWFCSLTLVYTISSRRMLIINPAVSFARQQNKLDFISLSAADLGCLGRACCSTNNVSAPKCSPMRIAQGPEVLSVRWDGCNVTTLNKRQDSSTWQLSGGSALNKPPPHTSQQTFRPRRI